MPEDRLVGDHDIGCFSGCGDFETEPLSDIFHDGFLQSMDSFELKGRFVSASIVKSTDSDRSTFSTTANSFNGFLELQIGKQLVWQSFRIRRAIF
jgi:hypothetical protein